MKLFRIGNTQISQHDDGTPKLVHEPGAASAKMTMSTSLKLKADRGTDYVDMAVDPKSGKVYLAIVSPAKDGETQYGKKLGKSGTLSSKTFVNQLRTLAKEQGNPDAVEFPLDIENGSEYDGLTWYEVTVAEPRAEAAENEEEDAEEEKKTAKASK